MQMTDAKPVYLTKEGLDKIKKELHEMRTKGRAKIANSIAEARAHGDLSENAEYDAAKEAQGVLEARIAQFETTVSNARLIDERQVDASKAFILSTVTVLNKKTEARQEYTLVSPQEADLASGRISVDSPVGKGLLGSAVGDVVEIRVPAGVVKLEVVDVRR